MQPTEAISMISVFAIIGLTVTSVARAFFNRPSKRALTPAPDPLLQDRLDRLETAVQAIAVEAERIAEGQRFTTRLLSHSAPQSAPRSVPQAGPGASLSSSALPAPAAERAVR